MIEYRKTAVTYQGDGNTSVFPFSFAVTDANSVRVSIYDKETDVSTELTRDYFVDMTAHVVHYPGYAPGEPVDAHAQPPKLPRGRNITIYRVTPINQLTDLGNKYPLPYIEAMADKVTAILQEHDEMLGRAVTSQKGSDISPSELVHRIFETGAAVSDRLLAAQQSASDAAGSEANAKHSEDAAREMAARMNTVLASAADEIKQKLSTEYVPQTQASREHQELRTAISNAGIAILGKLDKTEQAADSRKLGGQSLQWILEQINAKAGEVTNHLYRHIGGYETPTITALINWELMATENNGVDARNLRNAESGITACGGDNTSKSGYGKSCILLKQVYTDFDKILVLGCDDACTVCTRRVFDKWELDLMFANSFIFNIVDDNGSIWRIFGGKKGTYTGELSSGKVWRTHSQGCGIIEIYGIKY